MKAHIIFVLAVCLILACRFDVLACGYFYSESYLEGEEIRVLHMPMGLFHEEIKKIANVSDTDTSTKSLTNWGHTIEVDLTDLKNALLKIPIDAKQTDEIVTKYGALRGEIKYHYDKTEDTVAFPTSFSSTTINKQPLFDLTPYRAITDALPREFYLYLQGSIAWKTGDWDSAAIHWRNLLALPKEQRGYRSTWAAFMIGKSIFFTQPSKAIEAFEQTRKLADEGFADTLGLSTESLGWQARLEARQNNYYSSMRHYYDLYAKGSKKQKEQALWGLRFVCKRVLSQEEISTKQIAADPLLRQVMAAYILSGGEGSASTGWFDAIKTSGAKMPSEQASRLAWAAYIAGNFSSASNWIQIAEKSTPMTEWIRAKLLLREGKIDEAMSILNKTHGSFEKEPHLWNDFYGVAEFATWRSASEWVNAEIATLSLGRKDFIDAMDGYMHGKEWKNAAYVAERILTPSEVDQYIRNHSADADLLTTGTSSGWGFSSDASMLDKLRYLLARRYARLQRWDKAREYCPPDWRSSMALYADNRIAAAKPSASRRERAGYLMEAARVARRDGMEILGTELERDCHIFGGEIYFWGGSPSAYRTKTNPFSDGKTTPTYRNWRSEEFGARLNRREDNLSKFPESLRTALSASDLEKQRVKESMAKPDKRFHYRYLASDLMWQASKMLPDNDTSTALCLYYGGMWIQDRDPKEAEKFYKDLVRRCKKLPVGKEADRVHWFPKNGSPVPGWDDK